MIRTGMGLLLVLSVVASGCGGNEPCEGAACGDAATDGATDATDASDASDAAPDPCVGPPGLYADTDCEVLAAGIMTYEPAYWLWSDGLDKERFLFLPEGTQINTLDPDFWRFPVGTKSWKHFIVNGRRVETRYIERLPDGQGNSGWSYRTFRWNFAQTAVTEVTAGEEDVVGTTHDIPSQGDCLTCHSRGVQDALLSVSAIQLNHALPGMTLASLAAANRLSHTVDPSAATIPGTTVERAAFGYMHANCGNCHRTESGSIPAPFGLELWVPVGETDATLLPAYVTSVDQCTTNWTNGGYPNFVPRVDPRVPAHSAIYIRMGRRDMTPPITVDENQMPPLGTEIADIAGRNIIQSWINTLTPPVSPTDCTP